MAVKIYENGAWRNATQVKRVESGAWQDVGSANRYENGAWNKVWPTEVQVGQILTDYVSTPLSGKYGIRGDPYGDWRRYYDPDYQSWTNDYRFYDVGHFATQLTPGTYLMDISYFGWWKANYHCGIGFAVIGHKDNADDVTVLNNGEWIGSDDLRDQDTQYGNTVYYTESNWCRIPFTVKETCTVYIRAYTSDDNGYFYSNNGGYYTAEAVANWVQRTA